MRLNEKLMLSLDFDRIEQHLINYFKFPGTVEKYKEFLFLENHTQIEKYFKVLNELFRFLPNESIFDFLKQKNILNHLRYIEKELLINSEDFLEIAIFVEDFSKFLTTVDDLKDELVEFKLKVKNYESFYTPIDKTIYRVIDKNGLVKSTASKLLFELRKRILHLENTLREKIKDYLTRKDLSNYLQDEYYTIRKDRFVLPIKSSFRGTIEGIIHDRSNSGETVFIEPQEVVSLNNELIIERKKEEEEIKRILKELVLTIKPSIPELNKMMDCYVELDLLFSKWQLSKQLEGNLVELPNKFEINLHKVYNPLMKLEGKKTVPVDIILKENQYGMVISGPNAGGKTVALKTLGMVYLLIYAGIYPPVAENSSFFVNNNLYCIIGDNQSIEQNKSSFTAHLGELDLSYRNANKNDLILIDEILQNTDPKTGIALSKGYLEAVTDKKVRIILTTHYNELKYFALEKDIYINVSVKLDERSKPTFVLNYNQISESYPIAIAKDIGISEEIISKAEKFVLNSESDVTVLIDRLNKQIDNYKDLSAKVETEKKQYELYKEESRKFKIEKSKFLLRKEQLIKDEVDKTITKMKQHLNNLANMDKKDIQNVLVKIEQESNKLDNEIINLKKEANVIDENLVPLNNMEEGLKVFVKSLNCNGVIVKFSKTKVVVQTDNMKITTTPDDLCQAKKSAKAENILVKKIEERPMIDDICMRTSANTLNIIGQDTMSSETLIEQFIDGLYNQRKKYGFIIHGHGTGKLKEFVRTHLKKHEFVAAIKKASEEDGGDAVTIIELNF